MTLRRPLEKKSEPFVTPGPGAYKTVSKPVAKAQASMSSFVSTADRNVVGEPVVKVPPPSHPRCLDSRVILAQFKA